MKSICYIGILIIIFSLKSKAQSFKYFNVDSTENSYILTQKNDICKLKNKVSGYFNIKKSNELMKTINSLKKDILNFDSKIRTNILFDKKGNIFFTYYYISKSQINQLKEIELYNWSKKMKTINLLDFIEIPNADKFDYGLIYIPLEYSK